MTAQNQNPGSIGEAAITPQVQQQVAPEVTQPAGKAALFQKVVDAHKVKPLFDMLLQKIAEKSGGEFSSRVKQIETMAQKITQKKLSGREYGIDDLNDALGGRIVVKTKQQINSAKEAVAQLGKAGVFKINSAEPVKQNDYSAYHFDVTLPGGLNAELQIHDEHSAASAVINHDLRAVHGEQPENDAVKKLRDIQAKTIRSMPGEKAMAVSKIIQRLREKNKGVLDPRITARVLSQSARQQAASR